MSLFRRQNHRNPAAPDTAMTRTVSSCQGSSNWFLAFCRTKRIVSLVNIERAIVRNGKRCRPALGWYLEFVYRLGYGAMVIFIISIIDYLSSAITLPKRDVTAASVRWSKETQIMSYWLHLNDPTMHPLWKFNLHASSCCRSALYFCIFRSVHEQANHLRMRFSAAL